jgi:hypothetical protein
MPIASSFHGIYILLDFNDHEPPHAMTWSGEMDLAPDAMYAGIRRDGVWRPAS